MSCENKTCCCKCGNQITLGKHPWNEIGKGRTSELFGFACIVEHDVEKNYHGVFMDDQHGECEMFIQKKENGVTE